MSGLMLFVLLMVSVGCAIFAAALLHGGYDDGDDWPDGYSV